MLSPYMSPIERIWFYSLRILCGLILLFLILPVLVIIPLSFNSGSFLVYPLQGFSLHWYQDFFASAEWMRALKNSVIVAPAATVLAMVFGTLAAIGLTRGDFPGKALVMARAAFHCSSSVSSPLTGGKCARMASSSCCTRFATQMPRSVR